MRRMYGFFGCLSRVCMVHGIFPREDRGFKELRGFPDMELGFFRVAKSSTAGAQNYPGLVPVEV